MVPDVIPIRIGNETRRQAADRAEHGKVCFADPHSNHFKTNN
jgi:hypothetical protein